jgi:hypothetical protein
MRNMAQAGFMPVKKLLAAAVLLALTSCDPMYGQDPYGPQPYPGPAPYPQDPYPGAPTPYPGPAPYPPEPYPGTPAPYPGQPNQPAPPECVISSSRDWTAWINRMPGTGAPTLVISGKVVTPTGGYQVAFDPRLQVRKGYPAQAFVTLNVASPGGAPVSQAQITHEVRWEWPLSQPIGSVIVSCGDKTLAEITRIQTAY